MTQNVLYMGHTPKSLATPPALDQYLLLASGHLSFPLHLAPGDAGELPGHRPRPVDGYRVLAAALDGWHYLEGRDALVARLLGHDLDLGPLGRRVHLGLRRARRRGRRRRRRVGRLGKRTDLFRTDFVAWKGGACAVRAGPRAGWGGALSVSKSTLCTVD